MNARQRWSDAERKAQAWEQIKAEVSMLVSAAFEGTPCRLPRVVGVGLNAKVVYDVTIVAAINEAKADDGNGEYDLSVQALLSAEARERFKEAVAANHMKWHGDCLVTESLRSLAHDIAEARAEESR